LIRYAFMIYYVMWVAELDSRNRHIPTPLSSEMQKGSQFRVYREVQGEPPSYTMHLWLTTPLAAPTAQVL
jgi:hypothetical protein